MLATSSGSTVMTNQGKLSSSDPKGKKDYSKAILERKKVPKPPMMTTPSSLYTRIPWNSSSSPTAPESSPGPKEAQSVLGPRPSTAVRPIRGSPRTRRIISASLEASPPRPPTMRYTYASLEGSGPTLGEQANSALLETP